MGGLQGLFQRLFWVGEAKTVKLAVDFVNSVQRILNDLYRRNFFRTIQARQLGGGGITKIKIGHKK